MKQVSVSETDAGQRLDRFLQKVLAQAPKGFLYKMLRKKNITLNGKKAGGSERLQPGDQVQLFLSQETMDKFSQPFPKETDPGEKEPVEIIYEDGQVLLLNKPCGMLSQKSRPQDYSLTEWVRDYLCRSQDGSAAGFSPGVCNRLDRNTSGIVAAGKSVRAQQELSAMFKKKQLGKYYLCPVHGVIGEEGHLRGYLQKEETKNKVAVWDGAAGTGLKGEPIETVYRPLGNNGRLTLLEVQLITGKTHQIRAHLAQAGHPLLGDAKYGDARQSREDARKLGCRHQMLHAWRMEFPACTGLLSYLSGRAFAAGLPGGFQDLLQKEHLEEFIP